MKFVYVIASLNNISLLCLHSISSGNGYYFNFSWRQTDFVGGLWEITFNGDTDTTDVIYIVAFFEMLLYPRPGTLFIEQFITNNVLK